MTELPLGTVTTPNGLLSGLWALPRPLTKHWGSGNIHARIKQVWGAPDIVFGKQDQIEPGTITVDKDPGVSPTIVADWASMPFKDKEFACGYFDPPYLGYIGEDGDVHYKRLDPCVREICRVLSKRLFILSPLVYPCPDGWHRIAVIATTFGPNKVIRSLQGFERDTEPAQSADLRDEW